MDHKFSRHSNRPAECRVCGLDRAAHASKARKPMPFTEAIELLALNDDPTVVDVDTVMASMTVQMVADIYHVRAAVLARTIVRYRKAALATASS